MYLTVFYEKYAPPIPGKYFLNIIINAYKFYNNKVISLNNRPLETTNTRVTFGFLTCTQYSVIISRDSNESYINLMRNYSVENFHISWGRGKLCFRLISSRLFQKRKKLFHNKRTRRYQGIVYLHFFTLLVFHRFILI